MADATFTWGSEAVITGTAATTIHSICKLDATHFVAAYTATTSGKSNRARVKAGSISGTSISVGSEVIIEEVDNCLVHNVVSYDSTHFLVLYTKTGADLRAVVGSVSSNTITLGTPINVDAPGSGNYAGRAGAWATVLDSTHIAVSYIREASSSTDVYTTIITISSDVPSANTLYSVVQIYAGVGFNGLEYLQLRNCFLSSTKFATSYKDFGDSYKIKCLIHTVSSGTTITSGSETLVDATNVDVLSGARNITPVDIDSGKLMITFTGYTSTAVNKSIAATISTNTPTFGTAVAFSTQLPYVNGSHAATRASDKKDFLVFLNRATTTYSKSIVRGKISSTNTVSFDANVEISTDRTAYHHIAFLDDTHIIILYSKVGDYTYAQYGTVDWAEAVAGGTYSGSGSSTASGAASKTISFTRATSGSTTASGSAAKSYTNNYSKTAAGSFALSGAANKTIDFSRATSGSVSISGTASTNYEVAYAGAGPLVISGISSTAYSKVYPYTASGSLLVSAAALYEYSGVLYLYDATGSAFTLGGAAFTLGPLYWTGLGSIILSGSSAIEYFDPQWIYEATGSIILSGSSITIAENIYTYDCSGSITLSGEIICECEGSFAYSCSGSITISGSSANEYYVVVEYINSGSITLSGSSSYEYGNDYLYSTDGTATLSGSSTYTIELSIATSGSIILSGTCLTEVENTITITASGTITLGSGAITTIEFVYTISGSGIFGENLVVGGNCEENDAPYLFGATGFIVGLDVARSTDHVDSGSYSYRLETTQTGFSYLLLNDPQTAELSPLEIGKTYRFSERIYIPSASGITGSEIIVGVQCYIGSEEVFFISSAANTYDAWQTITIDFTVPVGTTSMVASAGYQPSSSSGLYYYIDNVSISEAQAANVALTGGHTSEVEVILYSSGTATLSGTYSSEVEVVIASSGTITLSGEATCETEVSFIEITSGNITLGGSALYEYAIEYYEYSSSGTITISGGSTFILENNYTNTEGGPVLSGGATSSIELSTLASGSIVISGSSDCEQLSDYSTTTTGSILLSGASSCEHSREFDYSGSGPISLFGGALLSYTSDYIPLTSGALLLTGSSYSTIELSALTSGSITLSGETTFDINVVYQSSGSITLLGLVDTFVEVVFNTTGDITFSGSAICSLSETHFEYEAQGYLTLSNSALFVIEIIFGSDGFVELSGAATISQTNSYIFNGDGVIVVNGEAPHSYTNEYSYSGEGLATLSGSSICEYAPDFSYLASGTITLSGSVSSNIENQYSCLATGSIILSGEYTAEANLEFETSGSAILTGSSNCEFANDYAYSADGYVSLSGTSVCIYTVVYFGDVSGTVILTGEYVSEVNVEPTCSGSILLYGLVDTFVDIRFNTSGDITFSGSAICELGSAEFVFESAGNITLSGAANFTIVSLYDANGQLLLSGNALSISSITYNSSGSITLSGSAVYYQGYEFISSGSATLSGNYTDFIIEVSPTVGGTIVLSGTVVFEIETGYRPSGTITLSGSSINFIDIALPTQGDLHLSGAAEHSFGFAYTGSGYLQTWGVGVSSAKSLLTGDGSITYGDEYLFNAQSIAYHNSSGPIDNDEFIVAFRDGGNSSRGTVVVGTITNIDDIAFGSEYVFNSGTTTSASVAMLSSSKFVIAYQDTTSSSYGQCIVGNIAVDRSISYGSEYNFNEATTSNQWTISLDSTHIVICYTDGGNSSYGTARAAVISGNEIEFGDEYVFNAASTNYISAIKIDSTHFVITYTDSNGYPTSIVATLSGKTLSFGSEYVVYSGNSIGVSTYLLDSTHYVVAFTSTHGRAVIGTISGNSISFNSATTFNTGLATYTSVFALDATHFAICYRDDNNSSYGTTIVGTISGSTVSFASEYVFNAGTTNYIKALKMNDTDYVVSYLDASNGSKGTAVVGRINWQTACFYIYSGYGSLTFASAAAKTLVLERETSGNITFYGEATTTHTRVFSKSGSGSITISGTVIREVNRITSTSGTILLGGIAQTVRDRFGNPSGGAELYGHAASYLTINIVISGVITLSGHSISSNPIGWGGEYIFDPEITGQHDVVRLDDTHIAVSWTNEDYPTTGLQNTIGIIGTVSGTSVSYGEEYITTGGDTHKKDILITRMASDKIVAIHRYGNYPTTDYHTSAQVGTIANGDEITWGEEGQFGSSGATYPSDYCIDTLSSTLVAVAYKEIGDQKSIIGVVSGSAINFPHSGTVAPNPSGRTLSNATYPSIAALDATHFVVASSNKDSDYGYGGSCYIATVVSGDEISNGLPYDFKRGTSASDETKKTDFTNVIRIDDTHFAVAYRHTGAWSGTYAYQDGYVRIGTVSSGNVITFGPEYKFSETNRISTFTMAYMDNIYGNYYFVINYVDTLTYPYTTNFTGRTRVGIVHNGDRVYFENSYVFDDSYVMLPETSNITDTEFVIAYDNDAAPYYVRTKVGSISLQQQYWADGSITMGGVADTSPFSYWAQPPHSAYLSGTASVEVHRITSGSGSTTLSGTSIREVDRIIYTSGTITLSGAASYLLYSKHHIATVSGGSILLSGVARSTLGHVYIASGSITLSGAAAKTFSINYRGSGTARLSGSAVYLEYSNDYISSIVGGSVILSGASSYLEYSNDYIGSIESGSILLSGISETVRDRFGNSGGSVIISGAAQNTIEISYIAAGAILFSGSAICDYTWTYLYDGLGNITLGDTAAYEEYSNDYISSITGGSILLSGASETVRDRFGNAGGSIYLSGIGGKQLVYLPSSSGTITLSGAVPPMWVSVYYTPYFYVSMIYLSGSAYTYYTTTGTLRLYGNPHYYYLKDIWIYRNVSGGIHTSGSASYYYIPNFTYSVRGHDRQVVLSGAATKSYTYSFLSNATFGSITLSGASITIHSRVFVSSMLGGLQINGIGIGQTSFRWYASGSATLSGISETVRDRFFRGRGWIYLSGVADTGGTSAHYYTGSGIIRLSHTVYTWAGPEYEPVIESGSITLSGAATTKQLRKYYPTVSGSITLSGAATYEEYSNNYRYRFVSGGITLSGAAVAYKFGYRYYTASGTVRLGRWATYQYSKIVLYDGAGPIAISGSSTYLLSKKYSSTSTGTILLSGNASGSIHVSTHTLGALQLGGAATYELYTKHISISIVGGSIVLSGAATGTVSKHYVYSGSGTIVLSTPPVSEIEVLEGVSEINLVFDAISNITLTADLESIVSNVVDMISQIRWVA